MTRNKTWYKTIYMRYLVLLPLLGLFIANWAMGTMLHIANRSHWDYFGVHNTTLLVILVVMTCYGILPGFIIVLSRNYIEYVKNTHPVLHIIPPIVSGLYLEYQLLGTYHLNLDSGIGSFFGFPMILGFMWLDVLEIYLLAFLASLTLGYGIGLSIAWLKYLMQIRASENFPIPPPAAPSEAPVGAPIPLDAVPAPPMDTEGGR